MLSEVHIISLSNIEFICKMYQCVGPYLRDALIMCLLGKAAKRLRIVNCNIQMVIYSLLNDVLYF